MIQIFTQLIKTNLILQTLVLFQVSNNFKFTFENNEY